MWQNVTDTLVQLLIVMWLGALPLWVSKSHLSPQTSSTNNEDKGTHKIIIVGTLGSSSRPGPYKGSLNVRFSFPYCHVFSFHVLIVFFKHYGKLS